MRRGSVCGSRYAEAATEGVKLESNAQSSGLEGTTRDLSGLGVGARRHLVVEAVKKLVDRTEIRKGCVAFGGSEIGKAEGAFVVARAYRSSLALTITGWPKHSALLSHPARNPDLDLLSHKKSPILQPAASLTSTSRSTPTHPENRQDGSPRRSPRWYEIRLLPAFPGEGYDQALDVPQAVQVCQRIRPRASAVIGC